MSAADLAGLVSRLETVTTRLESVAARGGGGGGVVVSSEFLDAYDADVVGGNLKTFMEVSATIGADVLEHAKLFQAAFSAQRDFLVVVAQTKTPKPDKLQELIKPLSASMSTVVDYFESHRASKNINHLQAMKEAIAGLGWVTISPKPAQFVKMAFDAAQFYTNRILKEKNELLTKWARALQSTLSDLQEYIKTYHTIGPSWNPEGAEASGAAPPTAKPTPAAATGTTSQKDGVLGELSQGGSVTSGLKKVTNEMKTYKNPALKASSVVKASSDAPKPASGPRPAAPAQKKPPVFQLQGKRWAVEWQDGVHDLAVTETRMSQTVYMYKCTNTTLKVHGKVNSIVLDNCSRCGIVLDSVIATVEIINCQRIQAQVLHQCPTVSIDKTDGCQVFLSKESLQAEIITAKSSEMNIAIPKGDGDFDEYAVPEQFKSKWDGKRLATECTDING